MKCSAVLELQQLFIPHSSSLVLTCSVPSFHSQIIIGIQWPASGFPTLTNHAHHVRYRESEWRRWLLGSVVPLVRLTAAASTTASRCPWV
ncbi:hypothetical protein O3P69_014280 [Scylla paramamosain]|uniref:Secreted protein n=1 Tax=Scylla paramamosain TaxID=85552 RepID=A0AAW0TB93_SCYPA